MNALLQFRALQLGLSASFWGGAKQLALQQSMRQLSNEVKMLSAVDDTKSLPAATPTVCEIVPIN